MSMERAGSENNPSIAPQKLCKVEDDHTQLARALLEKLTLMERQVPHATDSGSLEEKLAHAKQELETI